MDHPSVRLRARVLTALVSSFALVWIGAAVVPSAQAVAATCEGETATIEGPTDGNDTTGTEGDDVIVAPISSGSVVSGLGGNDTICLVDPTTASVNARIGSDIPSASVLGGPGDDLVVNAATTNLVPDVRLGAGADHFVGSGQGEVVYGDGSSLADTEDDIIDTRAGVDEIHTGSEASSVANHDVILTGSSNDRIWYAGLAGGAIDNGLGADSLEIVGPWTGQLSIDNEAEHANLGAVTVLTWTDVDAFFLTPGAGAQVSFAGSDARDFLAIEAAVNDLAAPTSTIDTAGGDDDVLFRDYLPGSVDLGSGLDTFSYLGCGRAVVKLNRTATCATAGGGEVETELAGIDFFSGSAIKALQVIGTPTADHLSATARTLLVSGRAGNDVVRLFGLRATAYGGRGDDRLLGREITRALTMFGGRGDDELRGSAAPDLLFGGKGDDAAYGRQGIDRCVAEKRVDCELR